MKYHRFILAALLPLIYVPLHAQSKRSMLGVDAADRKVEMTVSYEMRGGVQDVGRGKATLVLQDGCFLLESNGFSVYSDGVNCWTVNPSSKELIVDKAVVIDMNASAKQLLEVLGIDPDKSDVDITYGPDGALSAMTAKLQDGTLLSLSVRSIKTSPKGDASMFVYDDSKLGPKWVVTDLRAE